MSVRPVTSLIYGIEVDQSEAMQIEDALRAKFVASGGSATDFDIDPSHALWTMGFGWLGIFSHDAHGGVNPTSWVAHSNFWGNYACGFDMGNSYTRDLTALAQIGPDASTLALWKTLSPILSSAGIVRDPKIQMVHQII
jgi:hypothetical protein